MRLAVLAALLFAAFSPAFSASSRADLQRRARLLLKEIRVLSSARAKDTKVLRAELSALKAELEAAPDAGIASDLREAEADLALVDEGRPLPPPSAEEGAADGGLPGRDAVAQPIAAPRAPMYRDAAPAAAPEAAGPVFDGSLFPVAAAAAPVRPPPDAPASNLDRYLESADYGARVKVLANASAELLGRLNEKDPDGRRGAYLASRLFNAISSHPQRAKFIALSVRVPADKKLHLVYRVRDGGAVDEILGPFAEWSTPGRRVKGPRRAPRRMKKAAHGSKGGGDGGGDGGGAGVSPHGGHQGHGGGGGGGAGSGGGAGRGGRGPSYHAKVPHVKGGRHLFDGGSGGKPAGFFAPGRGGSRRGRGGRGSTSGSVSRGRSSGGALGGGRHAGAGGSLASGDSGDNGRHTRSHGRGGATVPLPKDFTTRGGGSRLSAGGERSSGLGGFSDGAMGRLSLRDFHHDVPPPPFMAAAPAAKLTASSARVPPAAPVAPAAWAAAGPAEPPLSAPSGMIADGEELHDAVAGDAAGAAPEAPFVPAAATPVPAPPSAPVSRPLAAACAFAAALGLGAFALRLRRPQQA